MSTATLTQNAATAAAAAAPVPGLHHVTAIAGDPQQNHAFYTDVLGMRMVKRTVNFDDPTTYHLYFGDRVGAPGSIMTFFPWPNAPQGRVGLGQATLTQYAVPAGALAFWKERLERRGVAVLAQERVFNEPRLVALDPDGLPFALVETDVTGRDAELWTTDEISAAFAIRGFYGVTLALGDARGTAQVLTDIFGYAEIGDSDAPGGRLIRYQSTGVAGVIDIHEAPGLSMGASGVGTVHHVAFSTPNQAAQTEIRRKLSAAGHHVTPSIDRDYFWAIYFRAPGGVLFEVATDEPGFDRDEPQESLGETLKLPSRYEKARAEIEAALPPLSV